jgi:putative ABC transport system ATP-binding protein
VIRLRGVEKRYRRRDETVVALRVEALDVARGEQVAIVGPSGCGKTTLLHVISGLLVPDQGTVEVAGEAIFDLSEPARDRFRARHVGYVHQTFNLLAAFTALENVMLGAYFAGAPAQRAHAKELLERVGLGARLDHRPGELSVGQQQRVAVARAVVNRPALLLADEPIGNQDRAAGKQTLDLMLSLAVEIGATVLMVTHDPASARAMQRTIELPRLAEERVA